MLSVWIAGIFCVLCIVICIFVCRFYIKSQMLKIEKMLSVNSFDLSQGNYHLDETLDAKLYQKIMDLYKNLEYEYKDAGEEMEAVKAYIADLSHQMKTPLANMKLYNELLLEDGLTKAEQTEFQQKIEFEVQKMEWMLGALTKIARLETKAVEFKKAPDNLKETVQKAVDAVCGQALDKDIAVNFLPTNQSFDGQAIHNPKWTQEALVNVLENATKYSDEGSKIDISVESLELYVRVNVKDYGIGISKKDYNKIFKRFYRGENAQDKPGSGLGLYLAQLIMNKQDGYIVVNSKVGEGSCFSLYFKRA